MSGRRPGVRLFSSLRWKTRLAALAAVAMTLAVVACLGPLGEPGAEPGADRPPRAR
ncbi:hypothetical protein PYV61_12965 [Roseisolibacter sp. H3M3-2]|nr:hypothetical protein [Roseisolibacter sp. H3M3-2]